MYIFKGHGGKGTGIYIHLWALVNMHISSHVQVFHLSAIYFTSLFCSSIDFMVLVLASWKHKV